MREQTSAMSHPTVAIVAWQALPAIIPDSGRCVGGMETAAWTFARGLASYSRFTPSIVVRAPYRLKASRIEGVEVVAIPEPFEMIRRRVSASLELRPRWRLKKWRPALLWEVPLLAISRPFRKRDPLPLQPDPRLLRLSPDVWIGMGVNQASAGVVATAAAQRRPAVVMVRSNADLDPRFITDGSFITEYGESATVCRYAIERATAVLCQTEYQQQLLKNHFGREGLLIRNPLDLHSWRRRTARARAEPGGPAAGGDSGYVAWVGRYDDFHKRPALAFEIAEACPEIPFRMVVNRFSASIETQLRSRRPSNVELIDYVPHREMPHFFAEARLFLSTSSSRYEGFPNVVIQAAATETPIVSLEDFDHFLQRSRAGYCSHGSVADAARRIREFWKGTAGYDAAPVQEYLARHHAQDQVSGRLAACLENLLGSS